MTERELPSPSVALMSSSRSDVEGGTMARRDDDLQGLRELNCSMLDARRDVMKVVGERVVWQVVTLSRWEAMWAVREAGGRHKHW